MPQFIELEIGTPTLTSPALHMLNEDESDLNEYLGDPTDPVLCVPEQDHDEYWNILRGAFECRFGGPGSTVNFWQLSAHSERTRQQLSCPCQIRMVSYWVEKQAGDSMRAL